MNLQDWIIQEGDERAAETIGVTPRAVRAWRYGERRPNPKMASRIVERTDGAVSFAGCYGHEVPPVRTEAG